MASGSPATPPLAASPASAGPSPEDDFLLRLAPPGLPYKRATRYGGDTICARLEEFAPEDQAITRRSYEFLLRFLALVAPYPVDETKWIAIETLARQDEINETVSSMQRLGDATRREFPTHTAAAKAIHDMRGGGLSALLGRLQLISLSLERSASSTRPPGELNAFFILARDHLKITRNAIIGLDDEKRDGDRASKFHHIDTVVEKWQNVLPGVFTRGLPVRVNSRFSGNMSECCLESAAIDRICYNLVNNACRHCSDGPIQMDILLLPGEPHGHLRFVISNPVTSEDAARLAQVTGGDTSRLFHEGVSTTGSGLGLGIVTDFVVQAFGLENNAEALAQKYLGARLHDNRFYAWFHWPAARVATPTPENLL